REVNYYRYKTLKSSFCLIPHYQRNSRKRPLKLSHLPTDRAKSSRHLCYMIVGQTNAKKSGAVPTLKKRASPKSQTSRNKTKCIMSNQVSLHKILKASPEKVFRAFTD